MRPRDVNLRHFCDSFSFFGQCGASSVCSDPCTVGEALLVWELLSSCAFRGAERAWQWGVLLCWQWECSQGRPHEALIKAFSLDPVNAHRLRLQLTCNINTAILKPPVRVHQSVPSPSPTHSSSSALCHHSCHYLFFDVRLLSPLWLMLLVLS